MTQPPPPPGPYQQPSPYQQPPKKSRKTLWIILGIIFGLMILLCGGCLAVTGVFFNEVENSIEKEEELDKPKEIEVGAEFEHDDYKADAGWSIVDDGIGDFTIENLKITNDSDDERTAFLAFTVYRGTELIGSIECSSNELQPGDSTVLDCFSTDDFTEDYDNVKVADSF